MISPDRTLATMLRSALVIVASCLLAIAPASAGVNLHNGLVIVHNTTEVPVEVEMLTPSGHTWEGGTVAPGHTYITHRCCYAAGTEYRLYVLRTGRHHSLISFIPKLCNRNNIPYGFAEFNVTRNKLNRAPTSCYTGPL